MKEFEKFKMFLVDDDPFFLMLLEQSFQNLGITEIDTFSNGAECLNHLHENPEVIFLDYNMDNLTGYEVLKKIKRYDPDIFVILVSAQKDIKPAVDSLKHGAFDYIQKSDDTMNQVESVLKKIVEVKQLIEKRKPTVIQRMFKVS
ncbi:Response regulator receiver domain-containing protein [Marivirga sericea]|uniref:Response regulator receiver domain-containing protein n=1 Tax=Marivirga sericea TaxID=1028 RepID=A0A1X7IA12_9BACT|nr:response regulator [Marivirga sericea]SMG11254.1 Response regulator receiver domain-containing protein [Marivirga sericea]